MINLVITQVNTINYAKILSLSIYLLMHLANLCISFYQIQQNFIIINLCKNPLYSISQIIFRSIK